jgi:competence protein ComFC
MDRVRPWLKAASNITGPRSCRVCDDLLEPDDEHLAGLDLWFCGTCQRNFDRVVKPYCQRCSEPFDGAIHTAFTCSNCVDRDFAFDFVATNYRATEQLRKLVHRFKYQRVISLAHPLAALLGEALREPRLQAEELRHWIVVPVPLHRHRFQERGFNQSAELAEYLCRDHGLRYVPALERLSDTEHQARLTRKQRLENLRGAFRVAKAYVGEDLPLRGARVLLVDDIVTTGSTTDACARALRRHAKVQKVVVIAVGRG